MTPAEFRRLALALPEAVEQGHMGHPDFRVRGKTFATLGYPDAGWAVRLRHVKRKVVQEILRAAWRESAPARFRENVERKP